jgi:flagellar basal-body rod modification protein FlgD
MSVINNATANNLISSTPSASSGSAASSSSTSSTSSAASSLQSTFLQLLVTQLQNQDPTSPMDSSQLTSQLAQINTVSGISQLNTTLQSVQTQLTATQQLQASALIGKDVLAPGTNFTVSSGTAAGFGVEVGSAATDVTVTIKNSAGITVQTLDLGAQPAGAVPIAWNGETSAGVQAPDGTYTISATATGAPASAGAVPTSVTATPLTVSTVEGVVQQSSGVGVALSTGSTVPLSSVADIF